MQDDAEKANEKAVCIAEKQYDNLTSLEGKFYTKEELFVIHKSSTLSARDTFNTNFKTIDENFNKKCRERLNEILDKKYSNIQIEAEQKMVF